LTKGGLGRDLANPNKKFEIFTHDIFVSLDKGKGALWDRDLLILTE